VASAACSAIVLVVGAAHADEPATKAESELLEAIDARQGRELPGPLRARDDRRVSFGLAWAHDLDGVPFTAMGRPARVSKDVSGAMLAGAYRLPLTAALDLRVAATLGYGTTGFSPVVVEPDASPSGCPASTRPQGRRS